MTTAVAVERSPVTIRLATAADRDALMRVLIDLAETSRYTGSAVVSGPHISAMLSTLLANPDAGFIIAVDEDVVIGLLVLLLYDNLISGERGAAEVCWYVRPARRNGLGVRLLEAAEAWAAEHSARVMQMISPDQRFGSVYFRRGYSPVHRVFERRLEPCRG